MPVKSQAQEKFLAINHPDVLHKWKAEGASTAIKGLPYKVSAKPDGHVGPLAKMFTKGGSK